MSFVSANDNINSSMRLILILTAITCTFLLCCVGVYIIVKAFKDSAIEWSGMGVFVGLLLGGLTGLGFAKSQQKKYEIQGDVDIQQIKEDAK